MVRRKYVHIGLVPVYNAKHSPYTAEVDPKASACYSCVLAPGNFAFA